MKRPAFRQKRRRGLDQYRLDGNARALRDERRPSLQRIHRPARRAGSFREEQELTTGPEFLHRFAHASQELVVAYIAGQAR